MQSFLLLLFLRYVFSSLVFGDPLCRLSEIGLGEQRLHLALVRLQDLLDNPQRLGILATRQKVLRRLSEGEDKETGYKDEPSDATKRIKRITPTHVVRTSACLWRFASILGDETVRNSRANEYTERLEQRQRGHKEAAVGGEELQRNRRIDGDITSDTEPNKCSNDTERIEVL